MIVANNNSRRGSFSIHTLANIAALVLSGCVFQVLSTAKVHSL